MNVLKENPVLSYLNCSKYKFDAVICLNSNLPAPDQFRELRGNPVLSADGAANRLLGLNIIPDYIIGDMDSLSVEEYPYKDKTKIIVDKDQESNDFEKVLNFAKKMNHQKIIILGFHGGDLEHTFNNWSVFIRKCKNFSSCLLDNDRYGIPIKNSFRLSTFPNELISLIPQPKAVITTRGLQWQLKNEPIELGVREGARNRATGESISVQIHSGSLMLFINSRLPYAPVLEE